MYVDKHAWVYIGICVKVCVQETCMIMYLCVDAYMYMSQAELFMVNLGIILSLAMFSRKTLHYLIPMMSLMMLPVFPKAI